jgi:hypothetical protein
MRIGDIFSLLVAALVGLFLLVFQAWSPQWWVAVSIVGVLTAGTGFHILWSNLPDSVRARFSPLIWSPNGKVRAWIGIAVLCIVLGGGYTASHWPLPWMWPIQIPPSPPAPGGSGVTMPPSLPIQSRLERFIFTCDVPPPASDQEAAEQKARLQKNIRVWGDSLGVDTSFVDIGDGLQAIAEAKTLEAKARFASMGIMPGITKLIAEARSNGKQQIIVVRADIPKKSLMIYGLIPNPNDPQLQEGRKLLAQFLEVPESACRMI